MLRLMLLANLVGLTLWRAGGFERPVPALVVVGALGAWTLVAVRAYDDARRRVAGLLVADLAIAVGALLSSPLLQGEDFRATVPGFWVVGALMAWAVHWRWVGGLVAAVVLSAADLLVRAEVTQVTYGNLFLLMVGGPIVGYLVGSLQQMATERDRAERAAAAAGERARLARVVHDGVLQVLALVQRRGPELGSDGAELGRLAGIQETALRTLVRRQDAVADASAGGTAGAGDRVDLADALGRLEERAVPRVSVVTPGTPVLMPPGPAGELVAAVAACLDNVARHVDEDAAAWVLLEAVGDRVVVSVRDEGPGIPDGRLGTAVREGRLGVSESIRGRLRDLGGTAVLSSGAHGTEWELEAPRW